MRLGTRILLVIALVLAIALVVRRVRQGDNPAPTPVAQAPSPALQPAPGENPGRAVHPDESAPVPTAQPAVVITPSQPARAAPTPAPSYSAAEPRADTVPQPPEGSPTQPPPPVLLPEAAATARMIAAHSPLRLPVVADPDSASNQAILHSMVFKALQRADERPPVRSSN